MRAVVLLSVCICGVMCQDLNEVANLPKYDSRYDYLDIDAIFTNKRLVKNYVECLVNANRCTPEGKALKRLLPEALRTKCVRCTERQKRTAVKIIRRLKYEYPEEWAKLSARWDPTGDFTRYFEEFLAKESFNTIPGSGLVIPLSTATQKPPPPPPAPSPPPPAPSPAQPMPTTVLFTSAPMAQPLSPQSTPSKPAIVNRFGGDGELMMGSPSSAAGSTRPTLTISTIKISTSRPVIHSRPTQTTGVGAGSTFNTFPTRFPLRPTTDLPVPFSTAITIIDQIGYKIIRTTELVTDLLRTTVLAVIGQA